MRAGPLELRNGDRWVLQAWCRPGAVEDRVARRARIVLLAADGRSDREIGQLVNIHDNQVAVWRQRYAAFGLAGLEEDVERTGRPRVYDHDDVLLLAKLVNQDPPGGAARWTMEALAEAMAVHGVCLSASQCWRIFRALDMKPQHVESWQTSHNPSTNEADYGERYFKCGLGLPYSVSEPHWPRFFGTIADHLVEQLAPTTALDVGCATGFLVAALAERGVDAKGLDISEYAVANAVEGARGRLWMQSLTEPIKGQWDLVTCIEVLEHMAPEQADRALDHICAVANRILFTSTPHDFDEATHINVRPMASWIGEFARRGFFRRTDLDTSYLTPWAVIVERRQLTPADLAQLYEVELAPLREEVVRKREALLQAERRNTELSNDHREASDALATDRLLSLVDQVFGLQAELAEAQVRYERGLQAAHASREASETRQNEAEAHQQQTEVLLRQAEALAEERRCDLMALQTAFFELQDREAILNQRLSEVLASRSWRIGQAFLEPVSRSRRFIRRRS